MMMNEQNMFGRKVRVVAGDESDSRVSAASAVPSVLYADDGRGFSVEKWQGNVDVEDAVRVTVTAIVMMEPAAKD